MTPIYMKTYIQLSVYFNDSKLEKYFLSFPLSRLAPATSQTLDSAQEKFNPCVQNSPESFEFPMY